MKIREANDNRTLAFVLCRADGQKTMPSRSSLLREARWQAEWDAIAALSPQQCEGELEHGVEYLERTRPTQHTR